MESLPPDFLQGYSWTPPCHLCSPPKPHLHSITAPILSNWAVFLFQSSIKSQRNLLTSWYSFTSSRSAFSIALKTLLQVGIIAGRVGTDVGLILLFEGNAPGTSERLATRKTIRKNKKKRNNILLTLSGALGNPAQHTHISHRCQHPHLDCSTSTVLPQLLLSSFLGGLLPLLISGGNFLALRFYNLGPISALQ